MKKTYLLLIFCCLSFSGFSATWYSTPSGAAADTLTKWWSAAAGTGTHPASFTVATDTFIIQSNMTLNANAWTVAGTVLFDTGSLTKTGSITSIISIGGNVLFKKKTHISTSSTGGNIVLNVGGNLSMIDTSYITTSSTGANITFNLSGNLSMVNASYITTSSTGGNITFNLSGNLSLVDTSYITNGNTGVSHNYINFNSTTSTLANPQTITWTTTAVSKYTALTINTGSIVQLNSNVALPISSDIGMTVNGSLVCNAFVLSSGSTDAFKVNSGASFYTANSAGINGSVTAMSSTTYSNAANYIYNDTTSIGQLTGTDLPTSIASGGSVTINNKISSVTLSQPTTFLLGATLNLENGFFDNNATNLVMNSGSNVNCDSGTLHHTPATYTNINLTYKNLGINAATFTTGNEFPSTFIGTVTVNKAGATITLDGSKSIIGNVMLTAGALDVSASNYNIGLSGIWTNNSSTTAFVPEAGTVTFNGSAAQTINGSASTTFFGLTLNNNLGLTIANDEIVNGTLTLTSGLIHIGTNNLILGPSAPAVAGTPSAANMIIANTGGQVRKEFSANGSFRFPIGDNASNFTPAIISFTAGTYAAGGYAGVKVANVKHPDNASANNYINRYWSVAVSGITAFSYTIVDSYAVADVHGSEAGMSMGEYTGILPWIKFGAANTANHTITSGAVTANADFTGITTANPSVTLPPSATICQYTGAATIVATPTATDSPLTYTWAPAAGLSATTGAIVVATPTITTTYTVTLTDGNGFTATQTTIVSVNPAPATITGSGTVCSGTTTTLSEISTGGTWASGAPSTASVSAAGVVTGGLVGIAPIYYTFTGTGCYTVTYVTVNPSPAAITGAHVVCAGSAITLADAVSGGVWSASSGTATVSSTSGIVTGVSAGVVTISYNTGCAPATFTVTVNALPSPIIGSTSLCTGITTTLSDTTAGGSWSSHDTAIAHIVDTSGIITALTLGTTTISYTSATTGCSRLDTVTVHPLAPLVGPDTICVGSVAYLTDIVGGGTWISSNPAIAGVIDTTGQVTGLDSGISYIVYLLPTGCSASLFLKVLPALPTISGIDHVCSGSTITLTDAAAGGTWSSDNTFAATVTDSTGIVTGITADSVHITYTKSYGCVAKIKLNVDPLPIPVLTYTWAIHTLSTFSYYTSYQWYDSTHGLISGATAPSYALPFSDDYFRVVVIDTNGCKGSSVYYMYNALGVTNYANSDIRIYPNPSTGVVYIQAALPVRAMVAGVDGKVYLQQDNAKELDLRTMPDGIYIITLYDDQGHTIATDKVIKQ